MLLFLECDYEIPVPLFCLPAFSGISTRYFCHKKEQSIRGILSFGHSRAGQLTFGNELDFNCKVKAQISAKQQNA